MEPHILSILPFILLLLSIAVLPLTAGTFWSKNYHLVSLGLAGVTSVYYLVISRGGDLLHSIEEYVMFISLLTALYVISGGILLDIKGIATPMRNVMFLATGAVIANLVGTTGASMLLIRPYIRTNRIRISAYHIIFFIFIVSNMGGALTPIGDPPLFLGFLKGIPFFWIIGKVFPQWLAAVVILLIVFFIIDYREFKKQPEELEQMEIRAKEKISVHGVYNFLFLAAVIGSVFITKPLFLREAIMLTCAFLSYKLTNREIHQRNHFDFHPIKEVAWLFIGIFITMTPVLELLRIHSGDLGITTPSQFYWITGSLSGFLDNAPTYLTFLTASMGLEGLNINNVQDVMRFLETNSSHVIAISIAAVFFGAFSYIGNGPNFMVKSIAEHQKIRMPGFFGYIVKYSLVFLLPLYVIIWLVFVR
ncbi:MAG: sodium:proton antiporter [Ignavibacteria bacterium]|nr:sodium:proton antiporter [Ignavibacteria bacterium]